MIGQSDRVILARHVRRVLCSDFGTLFPVDLEGMGRIEGFVGLASRLRRIEDDIFGYMMYGIMNTQMNH